MAQALPLKSDFLHEHSGVLGASVLAHALLLVLLGLNLDLMPRRDPQPVRLAIQATVVDSRAARQRAAEQQRREREARLAEERRRQEQVAQQRQEQEQRRSERQRADEQRQREAAAQKQKAEQQRLRELAAQKQKAEQQRRQELAAQKQKAEQQRQAAEAEKRAAESRRRAEQERREAQSRADLARQLAEEEELLAAADSGLLDQYAEVIRQKVERNWIRPASARPGLNCVVLVKQIPGGDVVDVRVTECNGDAAVVRSIEAAVLRSSPLPPPPDPKLFDRSLRFEFRPVE